MGRKKTPGLYNRKGIWHIDKCVRGTRLCESTGTSYLQEAESYLARRTEQVRQARVYGVRPPRHFREAAIRYLNEYQYKSRIGDDAMNLRMLDPYIGDLFLDAVHMGSLSAFIEERKKDGVKNRTINMALCTVRRILNVASSEWIDSNNMTWLAHAPKVKLLPTTDAREPYPLSWEEQTRLLHELPAHLARIALFKVNTGCREQEVCRLRWEWEVQIPELQTSVFIIPAQYVKNRKDRLVVLNDIAMSVVKAARGSHPEVVFSYRGNPIAKMNNSAWQSARVRANLRQVRVHDLKHTFGRRLRAAGVSFEDRQDLLGHKAGRITTHYSAAEISNLIAAANKVCCTDSRKSPALVMLKKRVSGN